MWRCALSGTRAIGAYLPKLAWTPIIRHRKVTSRASPDSKYAEPCSMANPAGEIGQLREEELPVVRVSVPPDLSGRVFEDDLDPGDLVFDGKLTPMLVWHERHPGRPRLAIRLGAQL